MFLLNFHLPAFFFKSLVVSSLSVVCLGKVHKAPFFLNMRVFPRVGFFFFETAGLRKTHTKTEKNTHYSYNPIDCYPIWLLNFVAFFPTFYNSERWDLELDACTRARPSR